MDTSQIQSLIRSEVQKISQVGRFGVSNTQRHIHNDIDSPYVFQPILTYVGEIGSNGTVGLLPQGWTVTYNGTGSYSITHNLGTRLYSVVASAQQSTNSVVSPVLESFDDGFDANWFTSSGAADTSFTFILVNINNKSTKLPSYYGSIVS